MSEKYTACDVIVIVIVFSLFHPHASFFIILKKNIVVLAVHFCWYRQLTEETKMPKEFLGK